MQHKDKAGKTITYWFEDVKITKPFRSDGDNTVLRCPMCGAAW